MLRAGEDLARTWIDSFVNIISDDLKYRELEIFGQFLLTRSMVVQSAFSINSNLSSHPTLRE